MMSGGCKRLAALLAMGMTAALGGREVCAQAPAAAAGLTLEAIETQYAASVRAAEAARVTQLDRLAQTKTGDEADALRLLMFQRILEAQLFQGGEPIAERVLAEPGKLAPAVRALAHAVNIYAEADRGDFEASLASFQQALATRPADADADAPDALPVESKLSLFQLYVRWCEQNGRYDIAGKAVEAALAVVKAPALLEYLTSWKTRLALVGQLAPALSATDLDGKAFNLADWKGEVVLVHFWASWCVPSAEEVRAFEAYYQQLRPEGLRVVGVNLDAAAADAPPIETLLPNIKRFVLDYNVPWPNLLSGKGEQDLITRFGVREVPSNVLIGRDGKIVALDLNPTNFREVVGDALGGK